MDREKVYVVVRCNDPTNHNLRYAVVQMIVPTRPDVFDRLRDVKEAVASNIGRDFTVLSISTRPVEFFDLGDIIVTNEKEK